MRKFVLIISVFCTVAFSKEVTAMTYREIIAEEFNLLSSLYGDGLFIQELVHLSASDIKVKSIDTLTIDYSKGLGCGVVKVVIKSPFFLVRNYDSSFEFNLIFIDEEFYALTGFRFSKLKMVKTRFDRSYLKVCLNSCVEAGIFNHSIRRKLEKVLESDKEYLEIKESPFHSVVLQRVLRDDSESARTIFVKALKPIST